MKRIGTIAAREFIATTSTRGFIVGLLVMPALITVIVIALPRMVSQRNFKAEGQIAVIDPTGTVIPELRSGVDPGAIAARREQDAQRALDEAPAAVRGLGAGAASGNLETALGQIPNLRLVERPTDTDVQKDKEWLRDRQSGPDRHLALVVVHPDAVSPRSPGEPYGAYDLYVPANLDDRVDRVIQQIVRQAIVAARTRAQHLESDQIEALMRVARVRSVTVLRDTERQSVGELNRVLPFAFTFVLFLGVMIGGQTLMTSTIEEKSSRVAEVLLSAVSPVELMAGKILGQMGVSLVALSLYVVMGMFLLVSFAVFGLFDLSLLFYLAVFFVLTYLVIGSLMAAIGAAVNEMSETQSLMGPLMLVLVTPVVMQVPIAQNPNSAFSVVMSFLPAVNAYAMLIRMASSVPPPLWQVWLSMGVGVASALASVWFAAKVFRIGLLMHGKPPNVATLVRWVRAA